MPDTTYLLKNGSLLRGEEFAPGDLLIRNNSIQALADEIAPISGAIVVDCRGMKICPGFIDTHCHGALGKDVTEGADSVLEVARYKATQGTTAFVPTVLTGPIEMMRWAALEIKRTMDCENPDGATILGSHLEGPFINPNFRGAQPENTAQPPNLYETQQFLGDLGETLRIFTLAPEMPNAEQVVKLLSKRGVLVAAGHSDCTYQQMTRAIGWGIRHLTHTFNAMRGIHHREPGMIAAAIDSDEMWFGFIADLIHVHEWVLKFFINAVGLNRCVLVTDAICAAGMPEGEYTLGGQYVVVKGRAPRLINGRLAGSMLTMIQGVRNLAEKAGIGLAGAIKMASENPARMLGVFDRKGSLAEGKDADACVIDGRFRVAYTFVKGRMVYDREKTTQ